MAEPVTLTMTVSKSGTKAVHDHTGKHPELHHNDALQLHKDNTWSASEGFTRIKFYHSKSDYDSDSSFAQWTPGVTSIPGKFDIAETKSGSTVTDVKLTDSENPTSADDMYYRVTIGGIDMDPEIVNKSGTGTGRNSDHWVDNPGQ